MSRVGRLVALALAVIAVVSVIGCSQPRQAQAPAPKVTPPAIKETGTLRAGVDVSYPPFGGTDNGRQAGLDIDVAAALAERLGLKLVVVPVKPSDAATALVNGTADVVLSVPFTDKALTAISMAGAYLSDGPAFFVATEGSAAVEPTLTLAAVRPANIGVQNESEAYWKLNTALGPAALKVFPRLRDALYALSKGEVPVVAGDAAVGAYMARDYPNVRLGGQLEPAGPLGLALAPDNTTLGSAAREALDSMATDGVLDAIRRKWVGDLPKLNVPNSVTASDTAPAAAP